MTMLKVFLGWLLFVFLVCAVNAYADIFTIEWYYECPLSLTTCPDQWDVYIKDLNDSMKRNENTLVATLPVMPNCEMTDRVTYNPGTTGYTEVTFKEGQDWSKQRLLEECQGGGFAIWAHPKSVTRIKQISIPCDPPSPLNYCTKEDVRIIYEKKENIYAPAVSDWENYRIDEP